MAFQPNKSFSESDERELNSVKFIEDLLHGTTAFARIKKGDKEANVDGIIELLDADNCINGKITVQVKTVKPTLEGMDKFPCPTSLFAYAQRTTDVVFLLAVDHKQKVVLWKYISLGLVESFADKDNNETITLHFDKTEKLSKNNVVETIESWNSLFLRERDLYHHAESNENENERLRKLLLNAQPVELNIPQQEVIKIQNLSDKYNSLLDNELRYVKDWCYPESWKQGLAIFDYQDHELLFAKYSIKKGENGLLLKQLPKDSYKDEDYQSAYHSFRDNKIKSNYVEYVQDFIQHDVESLLNQKEVPPLYDWYIMEYIRDFVRSVYMFTGINITLLKDYNTLRNILLKPYIRDGKLTSIPTVVFFGYKPVQFGLIIDFLSYLLRKGYKGEIQMYPPFGKYGNTGSVRDWYNSQQAFIKVKSIINYIAVTYTDFIEKNFRLIKKELDFFYNAKYVLINLSYIDDSTNWPLLTFLCFKGPINDKPTTIEYILNGDNQYSLDLATRFLSTNIGKKINLDGVEYECTSMFSLDTHDVIFSKTCLNDTFRSIFKSRMQSYLKNCLFKNLEK